MNRADLRYFYVTGGVVAGGIIAGVFAAGLYDAAPEPGPVLPLDYEVYEHNGVQRKYKIITTEYDRLSTQRIIVGLHGEGQSPDDLMQMSNLDKKIDFGSILVYPYAMRDENGVRSWNANLDPRQADDIGFLTGLVRHLTDKHSIGRSGIFGISSGGSMAYTIACENLNIFSTHVVISGNMSGHAEKNCDPYRPLHIAHVHGYKGATFPDPSTQPTVDFWKSLVDCVDQKYAFTTHQPSIQCVNEKNWFVYVETDNFAHEWPPKLTFTPGGRFGIVNDFDEFLDASLW